jgi:hypothetical protein
MRPDHEELRRRIREVTSRIDEIQDADPEWYEKPEKVDALSPFKTELGVLWARERAAKREDPWYGVPCQEVHAVVNGRPLHDGEEAVIVVWHEKDRRAYPMCEACGDHNVRNRGGRLLGRRPE